jgi:ATP-dependent RNA helicase DDX18/HAS1
VDQTREKKFTVGIEQGFVICNPEDRLILLLSLLKKNSKKKIITFFSSCSEVKFFYNLFTTIGLKIFELHGKQKQIKRTSNFFNFCKAKIGVLFCTDIAARGLDFPSVDWIIQFSAPLDPKEYVHRIGRTGRGVHEKGWTLIFLLPNEIAFLCYLKKKKIKIKEFIFQKKNFLILFYKIEKLIEKSLFLKKLAINGLNSFLKSYASHTLKDIFDIKKIDKLLLQKGFGLSKIK